MKRGTLVILSLVAALPAVAAGGCAADNPSSLIILGDEAPEEDCGFDGAPEGPFLLRGFYDLNTQRPYLASPLVESAIQVVAGEDPAARTVILTGAHVELEAGNDQVSQQLLMALSAVGTERDPVGGASGAVAPGGTHPTLIEAIDAGQRDALAAAFPDDATYVTIVAKIKVKGTVGTNGIESVTFPFAIDLCKNCSVRELGLCTGLSSGFAASDVCFVGQDEVLECCTNSMGAPVCPAAAETM